MEPFDFSEDDVRPFLAAIAGEPADVARRLVFADWLDDRGHPLGELTRRQLAQESSPSEAPRAVSRRGDPGAGTKPWPEHPGSWWRGRVAFRQSVPDVERYSDLLRAGWVEFYWCGTPAGLLPDPSLWWAVNEVVLGGDGLSLPLLLRLARLPSLRRLSLHRLAVPNWHLALSRLRTLRVLELPELGVGSDALSALAALPELSDLDLSGASLGRDGLRGLAELAGLKALGLGKAGWRNGGLEPLGGLHSLEVLNLSHRRLGEGDLEPLAGLPRLRVLDLSETGVSGNDLADLSGLRGLERLELTEGRISDVGVRHLAGFSRLRHLDLFGTGVSDLSATTLAGMPALRSLDLCFTGFTDRGLSVLSELTGLRELRLVRTAVTEAGVREFRRKVPGATVETEPPARRASVGDWTLPAQV